MSKRDEEGDPGSEMALAPMGDEAPTSRLGQITAMIRGAVKQKKCSGEFCLSHIHDTGGHATLMSREINVKLPTAELDLAVRALAQEFHDTALAEIRSHSTVQKYAVNGFDKQNPPESIGYTSFNLSPPPSNEIGGLSLSPTDKGTLAQSMGLTQVFAKQSYMATQNEVERLVAENERLRARVEKLEDKRDELATLKETMISEQWKRDRERQSDEAMSRNADKLLQAAMFVGKIALERWGIPVPQGALDMMSSGESPDEMKTKVLVKMKALLESLKPEQQQTILGCLDPLQQAAFVEALQMMMAAASSADQPKPPIITVMSTPKPVQKNGKPASPA